MSIENRHPSEEVLISTLTQGEWLGLSEAAEKLGLKPSALRVLLHNRAQAEEAHSQGEPVLRPPSERTLLVPEPQKITREQLVFRAEEIDAIIDKFKSLGRLGRPPKN